MNNEKGKPPIGVIFHPTFSPASLIEYAQKAENAGIEELWLWDDCFQPGALTSAGIVLASTSKLKVGIGLMPATVYNPLFAAMEITTLARAFPGRFIPGFGHGVGSWMKQIGAAPKSSLTALEEIFTTIPAIVRGEEVTFHGMHVNLEKVQMEMTPDVVPPFVMGGMRQKTLQLAGRVADGSIVPHMSSPTYLHWVKKQIRIGMAKSGRENHKLVVYLAVKVNKDGDKARKAMRKYIANELRWANIVLSPLEIKGEVAELLEQYNAEELPDHIPDDILDYFSASGSPEQVAELLQRWIDVGIGSLVLQPLGGDLECLDEYAEYLMPLIRG